MRLSSGNVEWELAPGKLCLKWLARWNAVASIVAAAITDGGVHSYLAVWT